MSVGTLEPIVAKRTDVTVKLDTEVVRLAKIVAAYRSSSVADYLSETLLPIVRRDLADEQTKTSEVAKPKKSPPRHSKDTGTESPEK
jgi:hypothetical protein